MIPWHDDILVLVLIMPRFGLVKSTNVTKKSVRMSEKLQELARVPNKKTSTFFQWQICGVLFFLDNIFWIHQHVISFLWLLLDQDSCRVRYIHRESMEIHGLYFFTTGIFGFYFCLFTNYLCFTNPGGALKDIFGIFTKRRSAHGSSCFGWRQQKSTTIQQLRASPFFTPIIHIK